jgi:hypothetical protein
VLSSFVLLGVVMIASRSDSFAQDPPKAPPSLNGNAAGGTDAAAAQRAVDPTHPTISEATALAIKQVLHRLEALKAREPKPPEPWAKGLIPDDSVTRSNRSLSQYFSRTSVLGGFNPTELRERLRHLAFTGRITKAEYNELRNDVRNSWKDDIMNWPGCLNDYAPEDVELKFRFSDGTCF